MSRFGVSLPWRDDPSTVRWQGTTDPGADRAAGGPERSAGGEIFTLYVLPRQQGQGAGRRLMAGAAEAMLREEGDLHEGIVLGPSRQDVQRATPNPLKGRWLDAQGRWF